MHEANGGGRDGFYAQKREIMPVVSSRNILMRMICCYGFISPSGGWVEEEEGRGNNWSVDDVLLWTLSLFEMLS